MDYIINYIDPAFIPIVIALWCIGKGIKESKAIKDAYIPALLAAAGVVLVGLWLCAQGLPVGIGQVLVLIINATIQGILCAAVAVWGNQIVKQAQKLKTPTSR